MKKKYVMIKFDQEMLNTLKSIYDCIKKIRIQQDETIRRLEENDKAYAKNRAS